MTCLKEHNVSLYTPFPQKFSHQPLLWITIISQTFRQLMGWDNHCSWCLEILAFRVSNYIEVESKGSKVLLYSFLQFEFSMLNKPKYYGDDGKKFKFSQLLQSCYKLVLTSFGPVQTFQGHLDFLGSSKPFRTSELVQALLDFLDQGLVSTFQPKVNLSLTKTLA